MRVFVALDIPDEVRRAIANLIRRLEKTCRGARWVRPESIHVTLKFIGEASDEQVERIRESLAGVRSATQVEINFRGTGFFPSANRPRVFWAGIEASSNLAELAAETERRMEKLGIARESRPFKPHLTLARFDSTEGVSKLVAAVAAEGSLEFGRGSWREFHLYQSQLKPGGAVYTRLATFPFVISTQ